MTVIWSNVGDNDTALLENIWKGIDGVNVVELNKETENTDETVMEAILSEDDTLVLAGHGSPNGLFNPWFNGYAFSYPEVGFVKAKNVFCIWCNASTFCVENDFECLATSMFISNVGEAYMNSIQTDKETINRCNLKFYAECNHCLKEGMSMKDMYLYLGSRIDVDNDVDNFNRSGLTLVENDKSDYKKRYERLGDSKWFNTHYNDKSLGEVIPILDDIVENQKSIPPEYAKLVNDNFWDLIGHSSETGMCQSDVAKDRKLLREEHGIDIVVEPKWRNIESGTKTYALSIWVGDNCEEYGQLWPSYELAEECGVKKGMEYVKNNGGTCDGVR